MPAMTDMPASRLFDEIFSRWLIQFERWKTATLAPAELHQQAFDLSHQAMAEYSRRLTRELGAPFRLQIDAAVYALVALMDETILCCRDWPALSLWQACPLEYDLWQTHSAGDELPLRIQTLLTERNPAMRDLAALYLRCLTLGFGVNRQNFSADGHRETCRLLWQFAFQHEPQPSEIPLRLEEEVLGQPLQLPPRRRLADNSRLHLTAVVVLFALLLLSQRLWFSIEDAIGINTLPDFQVMQYCQGDDK